MKANNMTNFLNDFYNCKDNDKNERVACKKITEFCEKNKFDSENILSYNENEFRELLNYFKPTSLVELSNLVYRIGKVIRIYSDENGLEWNNSVLINIDKETLWLSLKEENDFKRYFNENKYNSIIEELNKDVLFDGNDLYYKTLFMAIYEGMYNKNLTELKNLRVSDIDNVQNIVTLKDDNGNVRQLEISDELKKNLIKLSSVNVWYKIQGRSHTPIGRYIGGEYNDSIFKILTYNNKDKSKSYKEFYYRRLKTLCEEFLGYNTTPMQIFISGIMNRVYKQMKELNANIGDLRNSKNNYTSMAKFLIRKECNRVNYNVNLHSFMRVLKSYADVFDDNIQ